MIMVMPFMIMAVAFMIMIVVVFALVIIIVVIFGVSLLGLLRAPRPERAYRKHQQ
jgi:hypothetical protein